MKTFKEFIFEENANKIVQFKRKLAGATDPAEIERLRKAIADAQKGSSTNTNPLSSQQYKAPEVPKKAGPGTRAGGSNQPIPGQPKASSSTSKPTNKLKNFGIGVGRFGAVTAADAASEVAISKIKDPTQQQVARTAKDLAVTFAAPVMSLTGLEGNTPQRQEYQSDKTTQISLPSNYGKPDYEKDPNARKNVIYVQKTKPRTPEDQMFDPKNPLDVRKWKFQMGSAQTVGEPEKYGVATQSGERVIVPYGSVAGQKKVGPRSSPTLNASTRAVQQSRQVASQAKTYGATKGSALTGLGGPSKVDTKAGTLTTKGKTVKLASTQLVRDPKTGQQRVGDLAYKGGKATYIARASTASRDTGFLSNLSRATGIGGQRERDQAAAKKEYRTALKNTQSYTKGLGITTKSATAQKLPGYGAAPKPKPNK